MLEGALGGPRYHGLVDFAALRRFLLRRRRLRFASISFPRSNLLVHGLRFTLIGKDEANHAFVSGK